MFLKALTLRGFKSFASTTTMKLEPGITCIVGPNGSGKSNVVDALTWVMGEQGAKSLRGANMADVIFAGAGGRQALGRAQVELTIDNSDGRLPIDYSEVTISRTLFRGGGSEYAINGVASRLLDVQELLSDTGMGKQMHVIVGQGQLDAVLRATPEERRGYIDEAAGVLKHRRRKERALKKLEAMDANLVRVIDLTEEIKRQLRPLARQAKAAREAAGVQRRIDYATRRLVADDVLTAQIHLQRDYEEAKKFRSEVTIHEQEIEQIKRQIKNHDLRGTKVSVDLQKFMELTHQFEAVQERLASIELLTMERLSQSRARTNLITEAAVELAGEKSAEAATEVKNAERELQSAREKTEERSKLREQAERKESDLQRDLLAKQSQLEKQQKKYAEAREAQVKISSQLEASRAAVSNAEKYWEECVARVLSEKQTAQDLHLLEGLETDTSHFSEGETQSSHPSLAQIHLDKIANEDQARKKLEVAQSHERDAKAENAKWKARRDALAQSLPNTEVMSSRSANSELVNSTFGASDVWEPQGTVDQFVKVARGWEKAVSALLDPFEQAPVVSSSDSVDVGLHFARQNEHPLRAVVVAEPITFESIPEPQVNLDQPVAVDDAVFVHSVVGDALKIVFDDAWLAPTNESAQLLLQSRNDVKIVATLDGIVFTRTTVRGPGEDISSTLLIRAQWEDACAQAKKCEEKLSVIVETVKDCQENLQNAVEESQTALLALRAYDASQAEIAKERARAVARIGAAEEESQRAAKSLDLNKQKMNTWENEYKKACEVTNSVPQVFADEFLLELRQTLAVAGDEARKARDHEVAAKLAMRGAEEQLRSATRSADAFRAQMMQMRETRLEQLRREEILAEGRKNLGKILTKTQQAREAAHIDLERARAQKQMLEIEVQQIEESMRKLRAQLDGLQWKQNHAGDARQQAEVALAQSKFQFDQHLEKAIELVEFAHGRVLDHEEQNQSTNISTSIISDDVSDDLVSSDVPISSTLPLSVENLIAEYGPDVPVDVNIFTEARNEDPRENLEVEQHLQPYSRKDMSTELIKAEKELSRLGVVNPLAVEEHDALLSRQDFLLAQVADLKRSKGDLLQIIEDVDRRVQEAFEEAFIDIQNQFAHVFSILFPGGKGQLTLTDPDSPLLTGVEIYARPAGKRVTRLSLLSGGERSLAALAYLVAIFKARPSPFYVMDEVEAALDDMNLSRVLQIFGELQETSQLLLVTHQKRTMEIADALYGITMRDGITSVVSHKMEK